jgi:hypothetical protein
MHLAPVLLRTPTHEGLIRWGDRRLLLHQSVEQLPPRTGGPSIEAERKLIKIVIIDAAGESPSDTCQATSSRATRRRMSSEETASQPVLQANPSSRGPEAYMALRLLPVCCVCGLIRNETGSLPSRMSWVTTVSYRRTHHVHLTDFFFTRSYCPDCLL